MNGLQRMILGLMPKRLAASIEAESRAWVMKCEECGYGRSVWEHGGIRWKASGTPRRRMMCGSFGKPAWHITEQRIPEKSL